MSWAPALPTPDRAAIVEISASVIKSKVNIPWHDAERIAADIYPVAYAVAQRDVLAKIAAEKAKGGRP